MRWPTDGFGVPLEPHDMTDDQRRQAAEMVVSAEADGGPSAGHDPFGRHGGR